MRDLAGRTWPHARRGTRHGERGGVVARDERERERTERTSVDLDFKFQAKEAHISPR